MGTLCEVENAIRGAWRADTCSPDDAEREPWRESNPAWGQCDVTALVVNDLLGGELICGEVHTARGERRGYHWWNRLPGGLEVDLTRDQFRSGETVTEGRVRARPAGRPPRRAEEYERLRDRVAARLGPGAMSAHPARGGHAADGHAGS